MSELNHEKIRELLRRAIPPLADPELKRDLWPQLLRKLDQPTIRVPWLDWALGALLAAWCLLFPEVVPALLYHF